MSRQIRAPITYGSHSSAYVPVKMTSVQELHAAGFLMPPHEVIVLAFAGAKGEFVFTNEVLLVVRCFRDSAVRRGGASGSKAVSRFEYTSAFFFRLQLQLPDCGRRTSTLGFTVEVVELEIELRDEHVARVFYKAFVVLFRRLRSRRTLSLSDYCAQVSAVVGPEYVFDPSSAAAQDLKPIKLEPFH